MPPKKKISIRLFCFLAPLLAGIAATFLSFIATYVIFAVLEHPHKVLGHGAMGFFFIWTLGLGNLLCGFLSYSMLFNLSRKFRENLWLSFFSFFWIGFIVIPILLYFDSSEELTMLWIATVPFLVVQVASFFIFRILVRREQSIRISSPCEENMHNDTL